jgi:hypothetical protein
MNVDEIITSYHHRSIEALDLLQCLVLSKSTFPSQQPVNGITNRNT